MDIKNEQSIEELSERIYEQHGQVNLLFNTCGSLKNCYGDLMPEKSLADINTATLNENLSVNVMATARVYKYFGYKMGNLNHVSAPYSILATMSSSLGSLTFNKYGGWYAYRAGKAAQSMITSTASIELSKARNKVAVIGIDPGLVEESIPTGSSIDPDLVMPAGETSVHLWNNVIDRVELEDSGSLFSWDGSVIPI